jgi:hypothetical protein
LNIGFLDRPNYGFGLFHTARLAEKLGESEITAIEFGVAGGNGLVALEHHAGSLEAETGVRTIIFGFDTGKGDAPASRFP